MTRNKRKRTNDDDGDLYVCMCVSAIWKSPVKCRKIGETKTYECETNKLERKEKTCTHERK